MQGQLVKNRNHQRLEKRETARTQKESNRGCEPDSNRLTRRLARTYIAETGHEDLSSYHGAEIRTVPRSVKWREETFASGLHRYLGARKVAVKMGRLDKVHRKQRTGFEVEDNELAAVIDKLDAGLALLLRNSGVRLLANIE